MPELVLLDMVKCSLVPEISEHILSVAPDRWQRTKDEFDLFLFALLLGNIDAISVHGVRFRMRKRSSGTVFDEMNQVGWCGSECTEPPRQVELEFSVEPCGNDKLSREPGFRCADRFLTSSCEPSARHVHRSETQNRKSDSEVCSRCFMKHDYHHPVARWRKRHGSHSDQDRLTFALGVERRQSHRRRLEKECRDSRSSPNHGQRRSFRGRLLTMVLKSRKKINLPPIASNVKRILTRHSLLTVLQCLSTEAHEEPQSGTAQQGQIW
ncbi:hypothetical protein PHSY_007024 [Pseudozyma hubeiensis SY62]|uniref:Uncharacterized protein n=1 Tax=Pseudozyma hubeiensis (strain SY62) TaxID=1305764 RepID=R9PDG9_PSEHS|nr:hypothetical protein PHSY_007024 [Pseudozyma hubeiensis SY62]GAC99423.1 hypothetical protein PHSY_007024 [Pseudozyma hubeiensis SY62]